MSDIQLNTLKPAEGSKHAKRRVGRGIGSAWARLPAVATRGPEVASGRLPQGYFEGGQMPLQRRPPKRGFTPLASTCTPKCACPNCNCWKPRKSTSRRQAAGVVGQSVRYAKVIKSGELSRSRVLFAALHATVGARAAIEAAGGSLA